METLAFARDDGVTRLPVNSSRAMPASTTAAISLIQTVHPDMDHLMHAWRVSLLRLRWLDSVLHANVDEAILMPQI